MTWPSRFLAVPLNALTLDDPLHESAKSTPEELKSYMRNVPEVYLRLRMGFTGSDFQQMHREAISGHEKAIADTYQRLFSDSGFPDRLEAEFIDGKGLVVTRGRHRYEAARSLGLSYIPVHIRAADGESLERIAKQLRKEVSRISPEDVQTHDALEQSHRKNQRIVSPIVGERGVGYENRIERAEFRER